MTCCCWPGATRTGSASGWSGRISGPCSTRSAELAGSRLAAAAVSCRSRSRPGPAPDVDADRIRQAVDNLVGNALRFAPAGTVIVLAARAAGPDLDIEVSDDGPGFPAGFLPHAFERFARPDSGRSRGDGGAGLGLAIVRAIAAAHGGVATAANRPGGGRRGQAAPAGRRRPVLKDVKALIGLSRSVHHRCARSDHRHSHGRKRTWTHRAGACPAGTSLRHARRVSNWTAAALIAGTGTAAVALAHQAVTRRRAAGVAATGAASAAGTAAGATGTQAVAGPRVNHSVATTTASGVTVTATTRTVNGKAVVTRVRHAPATRGQLMTTGDCRSANPRHAVAAGAGR